MGVDETSKQDVEHRMRLEGREKVEQATAGDQKQAESEPKTAKYDSIDALADRQGAHCMSHVDFTLFLLPPAVHTCRGNAAQACQKRRIICHNTSPRARTLLLK